MNWGGLPKLAGSRRTGQAGRGDGFQRRLAVSRHSATKSAFPCRSKQVVAARGASAAHEVSLLPRFGWRAPAGNPAAANTLTNAWRPSSRPVPGRWREQAGRGTTRRFATSTGPFRGSALAALRGTTPLPPCGARGQNALVNQACQQRCLPCRETRGDVLVENLSQVACRTVNVARQLETHERIEQEP